MFTSDNTWSDKFLTGTTTDHTIFTPSFPTTPGSWTITLPEGGLFSPPAPVSDFLKNGSVSFYKPRVRRIIFNDPATIVFWEDGTKTVVKCMEGQPYSEYYGFLCALGKKIFGSNSAITRIVNKYKPEEPKEQEAAHA